MTQTIISPRPTAESRQSESLQEIVTRNMRVAIALRGCAQKDLAAAMGITPASLSQKFVGKTLWNLVDIEKASGFFNVKPEALVAGHGFEPWTSGAKPPWIYPDYWALVD